MLVLTRKAEECIHIGDNIVVTVLSIRGHKVRLGIVAPHSVRVIRTELLDQSFDKPQGFVPDVA